MKEEALAHAYEAHRGKVFGVCYRMTGSAADAEDLLHETFARALERPPARLDDLSPWLMTVAINLSRDLLRKRRAKSYVGPWLPGPIEDTVLPSIEVELSNGQTTEARYDLYESVSFAFLVALEALSPTKRAILILRDVFGHSVAETARLLEMSETNVKTTHHRARKEIEVYDRSRESPATSEEHLDALQRFFACLAGGDMKALERLLTEDVRAVSDGAGEFHAALLPVIGPEKVARLYVRLAAKRPATWFDVRVLNGRPAILASFLPGGPEDAPRAVFRVELDPSGRIAEVQSILATRKLAGVRFPR